MRASLRQQNHRRHQSELGKMTLRPVENSRRDFSDGGGSGKIHGHLVAVRLWYKDNSDCNAVIVVCANTIK